MAETWLDALVRQMSDLGPRVDQRVVAPGPDDEVVPAERYLDLDYLRRAIVRISRTPLHSSPGTEPDDDLRINIAASRFSRHYVSGLTMAALVGLALGMGLDLSARRTARVVWANMPFRVVLDEKAAVVSCTERPSPWPSLEISVATVDELREQVWRNLYGGHIAPFFDRLRELTPMSHGVLWSNAAEPVGLVHADAYRHLGPAEAEPFLAECAAVLGAPTLPGVPGPNPLRDELEWVPVDEPDYPSGVQTRRHCCTTYHLAERAGYLCGNCPFLPLENRIELDREQRDEVGSSLERPAAQRSIQHGLKKLRVTA
jgi:ferric iron reductase protein FhuF